MVQSVHSFGDNPELAMMFSIFMVVILVFSFGLVIYRLPLLRASNELDSWASREAAFLLNNWILLFCAFFVLFGTLAIDEAARESWLGSDQFNVLVTISVGGDQFELTEELLRVAGGLAAFSGFYFAVAILTDSTYREEFLEELTDEMSTTFEDRVDYLKLRSAVV